MVNDVRKGEARLHLNSTKSLVRKINRAYEFQFPSESEKEKKSEGGVSVSEFNARVGAVQDEIQELQDPRIVGLLTDTLEFFPQGVELRPDEQTQAFSETLDKKRIEAQLRDPSTGTGNVVFTDPETGRQTEQIARFDNKTGAILIENSQGRLVPAPRDAVKVSSVKQGKPEDFAPKVLDDIDEAIRFASNSLNLSSRVKDIIRESPEALGLPGTVSEFAREAVATAENTARLFGGSHAVVVDGEEKEASLGTMLQKAENDNREFLDSWANRLFGELRLNRAGISHARIRGTLVGLAYAVARSVDPSGRLSDFDVKTQLDRIGQSSDPEIFLAVIQDLEEDVVSNFETVVGNVQRRNPDAALNAPDLRGRFGIGRTSARSAARITPEIINAMSPEELVDIDPSGLTGPAVDAYDARLDELL
jgi:hypothetical protein